MKPTIPSLLQDALSAINICGGAKLAVEERKILRFYSDQHNVVLYADLKRGGKTVR